MNGGGAEPPMPGTETVTQGRQRSQTKIAAPPAGRS